MNTNGAKTHSRIEQQAETLLQQMTMEEKFSLLRGIPHWHTTPVHRLGIPSLKTANGPSGVRPYLKTPE